MSQGLEPTLILLPLVPALKCRPIQFPFSAISGGRSVSGRGFRVILQLREKSRFPSGMTIA